MRMLAGICATIVLALGTGCGGTSDAPKAPAPTGSDRHDERPSDASAGPSASGLTEWCINHHDGFVVRYPDGWHTNTDLDTTVCRAFDPEPIEAEPRTEFPLDTAVVASSIPATSLDELAERVETGPAIDVRTRKRTEIAGHDALLVEATGTGHAMVPDGTALRSYHLDLGERVVSLTTYDVGEPDFDTKRDVLDAMVQTVDPVRANDMD